MEKIIDKILKARTFTSLFDSGNVTDAGFRVLAKSVHPDTCKDPQAHDAFTKLNQLRDEHENGKKYVDDAGEFTTNGMAATFVSNMKCSLWSYENYKNFRGLSDAPSLNFRKYIPKNGGNVASGVVTYLFEKRSIPLSGHTFPQEHVNWILNRLLEYCAYLENMEWVHCGLNPESVFITPENHGIQIVSFYHLTRLGSKAGTISGRYKHWYPSELFTDKVALSVIDVECAKKIAIYLLGDSSGSGVRLRATHNPAFVDFVIRQHDSAVEAWNEYRELLKKNFEKKFYPLDI